MTKHFENGQEKLGAYLSIRVPKSVYEAIRQQALLEDRHISEVARQALAIGLIEYFVNIRKNELTEK